MMSTNFKKEYFRRYFKKNWQKAFVTHGRFWPFKGWRVWVNLLRKENLQQKIFSDNAE